MDPDDRVQTKSADRDVERRQRAEHAHPVERSATSSCASRSAACSNVSPGSTTPPGSETWPPCRSALGPHGQDDVRRRHDPEETAETAKIAEKIVLSDLRGLAGFFCSWLVERPASRPAALRTRAALNPAAPFARGIGASRACAAGPGSGNRNAGLEAAHRVGERHRGARSGVITERSSCRCSCSAARDRTSAVIGLDHFAGDERVAGVVWMQSVARVVRRDVAARVAHQIDDGDRRDASGLTTVLVMPTAARCAAWRCASDAPARKGSPAALGR